MCWQWTLSWLAWLLLLSGSNEGGIVDSSRLKHTTSLPLLPHKQQGFLIVALIAQSKLEAAYAPHDWIRKASVAPLPKGCAIVMRLYPQQFPIYLKFQGTEHDRTTVLADLNASILLQAESRDAVFQYSNGTN